MMAFDGNTEVVLMCDDVLLGRLISSIPSIRIERVMLSSADTADVQPMSALRKNKGNSLINLCVIFSLLYLASTLSLEFLL